MKRLIIICASFVSALTLFAPTAAQSPSAAIMLTWKAKSYIPLAYAGKALPSAGTPIDVSATLIEKNIPVNLASYEIHWYVNGILKDKGVGKSLFSFAAPRTGEDEIEIRAHLPRYRTAALDAFAAIPVVRPEATINSAKLPLLEPLFYFFNITDPSSLAILWNDEDRRIAVRASNKNNPLEFAEGSVVKQ